MSALTFEDLTTQMFRLYRAKAYAEAYELVTREAARFPEHFARMNYWRACFLSLLNDSTHAIRLLQDALDAEHWYAPEQLRGDPDLKSLQGVSEFGRIVAICQGRLATAETNVAPELRKFVPENLREPYPLLIALHGYGVTQEYFENEFLRLWQLPVSQGWLLALPRSSKLVGPDTYGWREQDLAMSEIQGHYLSLCRQHRVDGERVVVGGFSRGGELAALLVLTGTIPARGFIGVAPGGRYTNTPELWKPLIGSARLRTLRAYLVVGEQDEAYCAGGCAFAELLNAGDIPCELEKHPDLGHDFPPTFEQSLNNALKFILQN